MTGSERERMSSRTPDETGKSEQPIKHSISYLLAISVLLLLHESGNDNFWALLLSLRVIVITVVTLLVILMALVARVPLNTVTIIFSS